ncbi:hypothetical protein D3C81_2056360 [compost metagenome]
MKVELEEEIVADFFADIILSDTEDQFKALFVPALSEHQGIGQVLDFGALYK